MTDTTTNLTEEQIKNIVDQRVEERLEKETKRIADAIPYTRREVLKGVTILGVGAASAGLATYGAVGRAAAETGAGAGSIGTEEDPLAAIYVDELFQTTDHIVTDGLTLNGGEVSRQSTEPSSPEVGDVWVDTSEVE